MLNKTIYLKEITNEKVGEDALLDIYINNPITASKWNKRPAMLILPGGGYVVCSSKGAESVAFRFLAEGFNCFVLQYSINQTFPLPFKELAIAIDFINKHAEEFGIFEHSISLMGFSAGGHLALSFGTMYQEFEKELNLEKDSIRPFSIITGYAVTNMTYKYDNHTTKKTITGDDEYLEKYLTPQFHIDSNYPPTFIWTSKGDHHVPIIHSTEVVDALKKNNVKHEFMLFEKGPHGGNIETYGTWGLDYSLKNVEPNREWPTKASIFVFDLLINKLKKEQDLKQKDL